jgi:hypothetical protein
MSELQGRDYLDVVSYKEIAAFMKIKPKSLMRYRRTEGFPEPDDYAGATPLWHTATVLAWQAHRSNADKEKS